jgi:hypothetical protein
MTIYHFCFIGVTGDSETDQGKACSEIESQVTIIQCAVPGIQKITENAVNPRYNGPGYNGFRIERTKSGRVQ